MSPPLPQPRGSAIITYTGKCVDVFDPDPDQICIEDIAHALSNLCRFGGHTKVFYSVAAHCVCASYAAELHIPNLYERPVARRIIERTLLLHDAAEAYLVDVPRPIKRHLAEYAAIESRLMDVVAAKFVLQWPFDPYITQIDNRMLFTEKRDLCAPSDWGWSEDPFPFMVCESNPCVDEQNFLDRYLQLKA